ncbi:MAG: cyclic nucleotide-binding domain-containing protein [Elusimicrobia bacterium]|nr:cyclic nucleotide-binding domain-containing protein [Elusimicrobiota bacterium]
MDDILDFLKNHIYFSFLTEIEQKEFANILSIENFKKDDIIFKQGELGDRLYLIKEGLVRIYITETDTEETIALMKQGDIFGELSLYDTQPRSAYASALDSTVLLAITKEKFDELKKKNSEMASKIFQIMLKIISKRLRRTTTRLYGQF